MMQPDDAAYWEHWARDLGWDAARIAEAGRVVADADWVALDAPPVRGGASSATRQKRRFDASPLSITTPLARAPGHRPASAPSSHRVSAGDSASVDDTSRS